MYLFVSRRSRDEMSAWFDICTSVMSSKLIVVSHFVWHVRVHDLEVRTLALMTCSTNTKYP